MKVAALISPLKIAISKGLKPEQPNFDAEKITKEEVLEEYTATTPWAPGRID